MNRRLPFRLDTRERKILGVCAGMGRMLQVDPTFVRIAWVAVPLLSFITVSQAILAYIICAFIGAVAAGRRPGATEYEQMDKAPRTSVRDLRTKLDTTDRRLMAIDHHLNSSESDALAREIEALRKEQA